MLGMAGRLLASILLLGPLAYQTVLPPTCLLAGSPANASGLRQTSQRTSNTATGIITGVVVNERREPVARAQVQAFPAATVSERPPQSVSFSGRASGSAATDAQGRFEISGLETGEYLVAAEPVPSRPSGGTAEAPLYATTFHPSTIDHLAAARVPARASSAAPIHIELVRVKGARVSGSVVSRSERPTSGMDVRLFRRFGSFGSESSVAVVGASGTFEIPGVAPGWYRLTVAPRSTASTNAVAGEFASQLIEVQDRDIDDLSLVLGTGASISGRVVADASASMSSAVGLRVSASPLLDQYSASRPSSATVSSDWSFRMTGLSGSYQFTAAADRPPFVKVSRVTVDGVEVFPGGGVELTDGPHEVVVVIAAREAPASSGSKGLSSGALLEQFKNEKVFWRQFATAKDIADRRDVSVLPSLAGWLGHEDRHVRGNVAFIFGRLGDPRGFQVITEILTDRSERPEGQGIATVSSDGRYRVERQIAADRYYAAHLLGDLRDPGAVPVLVSLLTDAELNSVVPWALGQIGDRRAIGPLLERLDDDNPSTRVMVIYALETLNAREAVPRLMSLLDDDRKSNFGAQVSVADAARAAIARLR